MSFSVKATLLKNDILACPERGPSIAGPPSVPRFIELLLHEIARRILAGRDSSSICRTLSSRINALAGRFKADRSRDKRSFRSAAYRLGRLFRRVTLVQSPNAIRDSQTSRKAVGETGTAPLSTPLPMCTITCTLPFAPDVR